MVDDITKPPVGVMTRIEEQFVAMLTVSVRVSGDCDEVMLMTKLVLPVADEGAAVAMIDVGASTVMSIFAGYSISAVDIVKRMPRMDETAGVVVVIVTD